MTDLINLASRSFLVLARTSRIIKVETREMRENRMKRRLESGNWREKRVDGRRWVVIIVGEDEVEDDAEGEEEDERPFPPVIWYTRSVNNPPVPPIIDLFPFWSFFSLSLSMTDQSSFSIDLDLRSASKPIGLVDLGETPGVRSSL
jgi:hypothetical protein